MGSSMSTPPSVDSVPDDAVGEMLLRLPPHPTCLLRASLVCKGLHRLISDGPHFLQAFREVHNNIPPLLGFVHDDGSLPNNFLPVGDSPDRVSAAAFDPKDPGWGVIDSRGGRVLLRSPDWARFLVWDPMAGRRRYIDAPPTQRAENRYKFRSAAVVCAAGHGDHGDCHHCPFSVVFVVTIDHGPTTVQVYVYSSEAGVWNTVAGGGSTSSHFSPSLITERPAVLLQNVLYWTMALGFQDSILAFELETHKLYLINQPVYFFQPELEQVQVREEEGSILGLLAACGLSFQLWALKEYNGLGTEHWVMHKEILLNDLAPLGPMCEFYQPIWILCVEDNIVFVRTEAGIFEFDLKTEVSKRVRDGNEIQMFYPYRSFYLQN